MPDKFRLAVVATLLVATQACGTARTAPDFTLTDDRGQAWALRDQGGKAVALTFGFTHCLDTCPATLAKLTRLSRALGSRGANVEIAFVTIDPQRDTPRKLHTYLPRFESPRLVGLTGSASQIDAVETAYHVWAQRIPGKRGAGEYDMAHSAVIYFIDGRGRVRSVHDDNDSDAELARALQEAAS